MKRTAVINRYQHDKFSDWSTPGALRSCAAFRRRIHATPPPDARCARSAMLRLDPVRAGPRVAGAGRCVAGAAAAACASGGVGNAGRLGVSRAAARALTRAPRLLPRRAWRCATRPQPPSRRTTQPSGAPHNASRKGPPRPSRLGRLSGQPPTPRSAWTEAGGGFELWKEAFDGPTLPMILTAVINNGTTAVSTVRPQRHCPPQTHADTAWARAPRGPGRQRAAARLAGRCAGAPALLGGL